MENCSVTIWAYSKGNPAWPEGEIGSEEDDATNHKWWYYKSFSNANAQDVRVTKYLGKNDRMVVETRCAKGEIPTHSLINPGPHLCAEKKDRWGC